MIWPAQAKAPQAAAVQVRLVYYKDGKPAKGILVIFVDGDPQKIPPSSWRDGSRTPEKKTMAEGTATFQIAAPLPDVVFVSIDDDRVDGCMEEQPIPLKDVLTRGVALTLDDKIGEYCKGNPQILEKILPKPGEILIFIRKRSFWEIYG